MEAQTYGGHGYLVVYNSTFRMIPLWYANVTGITEGFLMSDNGYLIALDANLQTLWTSNSNVYSPPSS